MEKFEFDDEIYYYIKNNSEQYFVDSNWTKLDNATQQKVGTAYFSFMHIEEMNAVELTQYIKDVKTCGLYGLTKNACIYGLKKFGTIAQFVYNIMPVLTSTCRIMHRPQEAIDYAQQYLPACGSVALFTSLAGAYCDVKDYTNAKKFADRAYAMQGGGKGYMNELSLVYQRIQKETKETLY